LGAATSLAERLRQIVARRFVERGVTASFGVATCPDSADDTAGLLEAAESALYDAQRFGGNRAQAARPLGDELELVRRRSAEID
jgi:GGDEF domain-containing protein